ncbi:PseG/SpsG family protein [Halobacteriovorax sp. ZH1_bin.1]|uniref:PseG/SpsG family protein n=1 Tax=Halobacteriovorax sp. ZH1_bin.1 TaxID=3157723 RepID=UPI003720B945
MKKIIIVTVSDKNRGLGHISRCVSLYHMMKDHFNISFIVNDIDFSINSFNELKYCNIDSFTSFQSPDFIIDPQSIYVLDGYDFTLEFQKKLKENCQKLIMIDDLNDRDINCDAIINYNLNGPNEIYKIKEQYKGIKYALLRPIFLNNIKKISNNYSLNFKNALITLGGGIKYNGIVKIVKALHELNIKISVIINPLHPEYRQLKEMNVELYWNLNEVEIYNIFENKDFVISAPSVTSFELLSMLKPFFVIQTADNQEKNFKELINQKLAFNLGHINDLCTSKLKKTISTVLRDKLSIHKTRERQKSIIKEINPDNYIEVFN